MVSVCVTMVMVCDGTIGPLSPLCVIQLIRLVSETLAHTAARPLTTLAAAGREEEDEEEVRDMMV